MNKTTIAVEETTKKRLDTHKPSPGTSYDWVINHILDKIEEKKG